MAALGNVLLAWFNARLSWKVVWQSDSDLLDSFWWGTFITPNEGRRSSRDKWRRRLPARGEKAFGADTPPSTHLTPSLINTASSCNQYLLCWLIVTKKSPEGMKHFVFFKRNERYNEGGQDAIEVCSLWTRSCVSRPKMNYGNLTQVTHWPHTLFHIQ